MHFVNSKLTKRFDLISTHVILGGFALFALFPIVYTLMTSFKNETEVLTRPPTFFPSTLVTEGYEVVFNSEMVRYYIPNSIFNSMVSSVVVVVLASLAGYTFTRYKFRGSRALELAILGLMMIPGLTNLIPLYRIASELRALNSNIFIVAVYTAGGLPFAIWIIRSFFETIPIELEEAALIDGCTPIQALRMVIMPLAAPGLLAGFLLMFVDTWNEFLAALVLLSGNARTVTVGMYDFQSSFEIAYHVWTAACILIMLPVIVLFIGLRKQFFEAMLAGALKG
ncbi:MAG: carbohydrate ABC transporter permease [Anaerolinea sp.]|nr:carbohydrate ABC transporter permease [Anaerolinea sp.]MCC6972535.1 carbohydrate ABC transporter permease [Anaerolineae bacterium]CAG1008300.1 Diacetylchitobiose uptake system permease protein DasC [Anaerolineae bacterium]